jgi:hypothetical protein
MGKIIVMDQIVESLTFGYPAKKCDFIEDMPEIHPVILQSRSPPS